MHHPRGPKTRPEIVDFGGLGGPGPPGPPLDRPGPPRTSICTKNQPRKPILRPFRDDLTKLCTTWTSGVVHNFILHLYDSEQQPRLYMTHTCRATRDGFRLPLSPEHVNKVAFYDRPAALAAVHPSTSVFLVNTCHDFLMELPPCYMGPSKKPPPPRAPGRDFVPYPPKHFDLRPRRCSIPMERALGSAERAQGPFRRHGTAPWPQIKGFLGCMEQNPGRGPWGGRFFGRTHMRPFRAPPFLMIFFQRWAAHFQTGLALEGLRYNPRGGLGHNPLPPPPPL